MLLIKYSEIGVKGKNRYIFEDMLVRNIKSALKELPGGASVRKAQGRIYVECQDNDTEDAITALTKVFGIAWICPLDQYDKLSFSEIVEAAKKHIAENFDMNEKHTFKVFCRRPDKTFPMTSVEVNEKVGEALLDEYPNLSVDVHTPEIMLNIEIRPYDVNFYSKQIEGLSGMPVGSSGKAMLLLSGGIDSPVAGYMVAKRGVSIDAIYFHAPPYTSERAKQKVVDLAKIVSRYSGPINLHVVNFTEIQMKIYEICPHDELTIIMRRFMMRLAEHFAKKNGCLGLVTGESIGQVASQTVQALVTTDAVCDIPVFRPLIGFDKEEIIKISQKIGAFETSIEPYEDCCTIFVAKHPVTKPELEKIEKHEAQLIKEVDMDAMIKTAIETKERILCKGKKPVLE